jgi:hypothetical protein
VIPGDFLSLPTIDTITKKAVEAADADLQFDINFLQTLQKIQSFGGPKPKVSGTG